KTGICVEYWDLKNYVKKLFFAAFLVSLLVACREAAGPRNDLQQPNASSVNIELEPGIKIGLEDGSTPLEAEALLGKPARVATSSARIVYVVDNMTTSVKSYTPEGQFIREIGREGEGPGEFGRIGCIFLDAEDHLYVSDPDANKFERFNANGDYQQTLRMDTAQRLFPHSCVLLQDDRLAIVSHQNHNPEPGGDSFVSIYSMPSGDARRMDKVSHIGGFEQYTRGDGPPETLRLLARSFPGHISSSGNDVTYASGFYDGRLHVYDAFPSPGPSTTFELPSAEAPPFEVTDESRRFTISIFSRLGELFVLANAKTIGLFQDDDFYYLLTDERDGESRVVRLRVIRLDGQYLGHRDLFSEDGAPTSFTGIQPSWMSSEGELFIINTREVPHVYSLRINVMDGSGVSTLEGPAM
ncbi:MAG: 6-bladed beta-propeller, partial [Bacteroidota bacterium]